MSSFLWAICLRMQQLQEMSVSQWQVVMFVELTPSGMHAGELELAE